MDLGDKDIIGPLCSSSLCGHIELISNWRIKDRWLNLVDQRWFGTKDSHHKVIVLSEQNGERNCSIPLGMGGGRSSAWDLGLSLHVPGKPSK